MCNVMLQCLLIMGILCIGLVVWPDEAHGIYWDKKYKEWVMPNEEYLLVLEHSCIKHMQKGEFRRAREVWQFRSWQAANRQQISGENIQLVQPALDAARAAKAQMGERWHCDPPPGIWSEIVSRQRDRGEQFTKVSGDELVFDRTVRSAMEQAWKESLDGQGAVQEQGGWIVTDADEHLTIERWPVGSTGNIFATTRPPNAVGHFHTHPYAASEVLVHLPSPLDIDFTRRHRLPGFIIDRQSILRIDPNVSEEYHHDVIPWR